MLATGDGGLEALEHCDVVVKTPGLSRYRPDALHLPELGVPVVGGLGLWLAEQDLSRVLCVTGTKGKSTTASITGHLLNGVGLKCLVGGNIGVVPYDPATNATEEATQDDWDYWVIEVSSYQATDLPCTPPVTAVTSLHPDHLDWHGGVEQYYRDKLSMCSQPGAELTVANGDSGLLRHYEKLLGPRVEWVSRDDDPDATWMEPLGLLGQHNRRNALIARRCLAALGVSADDEQLSKAAEGYQHLPSRLTPVATIDGVTFVDDSLSTNVLPTLAALEAFGGRRIALIVGGHDRGIDYAPLAEGLATRDEPTLVLTLPGSGPRIHAEITRAAPGVDVIDCPDLDAAVRPASSGAGRTAWSCSPRPRRASATTATTGTAATPSPAPSTPRRANPAPPPPSAARPAATHSRTTVVLPPSPHGAPAVPGSRPCLPARSHDARARAATRRPRPARTW